MNANIKIVSNSTQAQTFKKKSKSLYLENGEEIIYSGEFQHASCNTF